jgi:5'(3')-deoxyribonucleotidase
MKGSLKIYLDLDGVFSDFDNAVISITGLSPQKLTQDELWRAINAKKKFFAELKVLEGSMLLWERVKEYNPVFLTGAPRSASFQEQKKAWVANVFGPEYIVHVVPRQAKKDFSGPHSLLIDDTLENIQAWVAAGGHGIHHIGCHVSTIKNLDRLLQSLE